MIIVYLSALYLHLHFRHIVGTSLNKKELGEFLILDRSLVDRALSFNRCPMNVEKVSYEI